SAVATLRSLSSVELSWTAPARTEPRFRYRLTDQSVIRRVPPALTISEMPGPPLPYRGAFGTARPARLSGLSLPPEPMPARQRMRPLKMWRYVGVYGPELMICLGAVRVGPTRQAFWAVWDRQRRRLHERTVIGRGPVELAYGLARVSEQGVEIDVALEETAGVEVVCPSGESYAWTR